jgi:uncharacterized tellurite resistance protein B-like protein
MQRNTDPAFVRDMADEKIEALVEMMFLAATADGELGAQERSQFVESVETLTSRVVTGEKLDDLVERARQALKSSGREARLAAVKARLPDPSARRLALALAIRVTAADGLVRTSERELILETAEALGIDGETAADMVTDLARS